MSHFIFDSQIFDHFDQKSPVQFWQQGYFSTDHFFKGNKWQNNVIFLEIGGEKPVDGKIHANSLTLELGSHFKAVIYRLEHRFMSGSSQLPGWNDKYLKYLTTNQSIEDIARFIQYVVHRQYPRGKVVLVGCLYGATLATLTKYKHPQLIVGVVACSPTLSFDWKQLEDYTEDFGAEVCSFSPNAIHPCPCPIDIFEHILDVEKKKQIDNSDIYLKQLSHRVMFRLIYDRNFDFDYYAANCFTMIGKKRTKYGPEFMNEKFKKVATDLRTKLPERYDRQWQWLACNELGLMDTNGEVPILYGANFNFTTFDDLCKHYFGNIFEIESIEQRIQQTKANYEGLFDALTNVVFYTGEMDPWHQRHTIENPNNNRSVFAFLSKTGDHCDLEKWPELLGETKSILETWIEGFNSTATVTVPLDGESDEITTNPGGDAGVGEAISGYTFEPPEHLRMLHGLHTTSSATLSLPSSRMVHQYQLYTIVFIFSFSFFSFSI